MNSSTQEEPTVSRAEVHTQHSRVLEYLSSRVLGYSRRLKEASLSYDCGNLLGNHGFPTGLAMLNFGQNISGKNVHNRWVASDDRYEITALEEMSVEIAEVKFDLEVYGIDPDIHRKRVLRFAQGSSRRLGGVLHAIAVVGIYSHRIDVELDQIPEQASKRLQNAAIEVLVKSLVEDLQQVIYAHYDSDHVFGVAPEITDQSVKLQIVGNKHVVADRSESVNAGQKIPVIDVSGGQEVMHCDFHEHDDFNVVQHRFGGELSQGTPHHVEVDERHRAETPALNDNCLFIKYFRRLQDFAFGAEHHGIGKLIFDQLQTHNAVVHIGEERPGEINHVDLDPAQSQTVGQRANKFVLIVNVIESAKDQVNPDNDQSLLLQDILFVRHSDVQNNVAGRCSGCSLEPHPHPAVTFIGAFEALGCHRVGKHEKCRPVAPSGVQPLNEKVVLTIKHEFQSLS